jgi:hypothetical protein
MAQSFRLTRAVNGGESLFILRPDSTAAHHPPTA